MKRVFWLAALLMALPPAAWSSSVVSLAFPEVVESAELVFEGRVESVESRQTGPRRIHTFVRFRVLDVVKGDYSDRSLELRFLGGSVNGRRMRVTDMRLPEVGETGIYFVESMDRPLVHPLVGWSQGHFRVEPDAGGEQRVFTADRRPVAGRDVEPGRSAAAPEPADHDMTARGLNVMALDVPEAAMMASDFKALVRKTMAPDSSEPGMSP
ncbi:MAG: hypothetical protein ACQETO_03455 [Pseudomonadota bacterium]